MVTTVMCDAALEYAIRGVPIIQAWHAEGARCGCRALDCSAGKHPIAGTAPAAFKNATTDTATIERWFELFPQANIAEATGHYSSVIDVDPAKGGRETLARLEAKYGALPVTPKVLTGGGGEHYRFSPVPGLRCSEGKIGPGVDVRSEGGYALLPPSNHVSGGTYLDDLMAPMFETPLAAMPAWLVALAMAPQNGNGNGHTKPDEWAERLQGAPEGQRRAVALQIAGHYLGMRIAPAEVETIVSGYAGRCTPPFPEGEVRELVRDLARRDRAKAAPPSERADSGGPEWAAPALAGPVAILPLGVGLDVFMAQTFPPVTSYIEGLLTDDGGGWIGGEEKLGKSYYALHEALCLALGVPVAGRYMVPARRRVLFIEDEDSPRRVHHRIPALLRGLGLDPGDPATFADLGQWFRVAVWEGVKLDSPAMVARLDATLAMFQPAVCYLDVLRKMTGANLNKPEEIGPCLEVLDTLRRRHGPVFRVLHHYRKTQGFRVGRGSQEISGSFVLGAWGEQSLFFEPTSRKPGAPVVVTIQSKDTAPAPGFTLRIETEGPHHAPAVVRFIAEEQKTADDADELVYQALATLPTIDAISGKPGVPIAAVVEAVKRADKTVRRSLGRLGDAQRVLVTGQASRRRDLYAVRVQ